MVVQPKECLEPTEAEYTKRDKLCNHIDAELKAKYISPGMTVTVRYSDDEYNIKVVRMVISLYEEAGWRVDPGSDVSYDPLDSSTYGSPYLNFTA